MHIRLRSLVMTVALLLAALTAGYAQTFSVLYDFGTQAGDPLSPQASGVIAQGRDGNLYSTAVGGTGAGAVFKITPQGTLSVIYNFDGYSPVSGLTLGTDGNFYGATLLGGASDEGTLFKITPDGKWTLLHNFGDADGDYVNAPPIESADELLRHHAIRPRKHQREWDRLQTDAFWPIHHTVRLRWHPW